MKKLSLILITLFISGCASGPLNKPQTYDIPQSWVAPNIMPEDNIVRETRWWHSYQDAQLNNYVEQVIQENLDIKVAALNVQRSYFQSKLTNTNLRPNWDANVNGTVNKNLKTGGPSNRNYSANTSLSYEVDIWGKLSAQRDLSRWQLEATEEDFEATKMVLIGNAVSLYYQHAYLKESLNITYNSLNYYQQILDLAQTKQELGASSALDVLEAKRTLSTQRASLKTLEQQLYETENALKILVNQTPESSLGQLPEQLPINSYAKIRADIPAYVLAARPDMRAAEYRLRASYENVDVTTKSYYPGLNLTSSIGTSSQQLGNILSNPVGALGAGIILPFLNFNERKWNIKISENDYEATVINFRQTLLNALQDVENNLSAYENQKARLQEIESSYESAVKIADINKARYEYGQIELRDWLISQEALRQNELNIAQTRYDLLVIQSQIYQAMGGYYINRY